MPRSGLEAESRSSAMSVITRSVSPGRTGRGNWTSPMPGEPRLQERNTPWSSHSRKVTAMVCRPDAISPPKVHFLANSASMWKGCGSHCRAKSMIADSVMVSPALVNRSPTLKSS